MCICYIFAVLLLFSGSGSGGFRKAWRFATAEDVATLVVSVAQGTAR